MDLLSISNSSADENGGAIAVLPGADSVFLGRSSLRQNSAAGNGAAIWNAGDLTVNSSSFDQNQDPTPPGGGAIHVESSGTLNILNTSISDNVGNAIDVLGGELVASNLTLFDNSGWGIRFLSAPGAELTVHNSILAENNLGACSVTGASGTVSTHRFILYNGAETCGLADEASNIAGDPMLGPLQENTDSPSWYRLPMDGSLAIDNGAPPLSAIGILCSPLDQIGTLRPVDGDGDGVARCDIGAIEVQTGGSDAIFSDRFEDP